MSKWFLALIIAPLFVYSQTSEKYNSEFANFYRAEELFEKEQYSAARKEFRNFINELNKPNDPQAIKAQYYEGISALELYNNDAIKLLEQFNKDYPESIYKHDIYFRLGKSFYQKKKYDEALNWFKKLSVFDVEEEDRDEFYFKVGYANFKEQQFEEARNAFYEIKDGSSQYASPALYYYSHIAYQNKAYQVALDGFLKLENDENFAKVVPYYIAQIYYLQGKYDLVTDYAPKISLSGSTVNENDLNHLIGDAYYRTGKYKESVQYLEAYNKASQTSRHDDYQLGYAYYKSQSYEKAIRMFDRVKKVEDSLGQVAYYHIGESLLRMENLLAARSAFEGAARINKDQLVQEDALYNYAILSYKLDINPYDEAVEAFELYLTKYPNSKRKEDIYQYLVNVYTSTNNYAKALTSLDKIPNKDIRLKTAYQLVAFNQGVERFQKSDYTGSIASFKLVDKYLVDQAMSAKAVFWIADANYRMKKYDVAIAEYKRFVILPAIQNSEMKNDAYYNIGYCYLNQKSLPNAIDAFRIYIQSSSIDKRKKTDANMRIADAYFVTKQNELAIKFYQDALNLNAGFEDQALFYLAMTYGYMPGKTGEKIARLVELMDKYGKSKFMLSAIFEIAESYKSEGQYDKALHHYRRIVSDYSSTDLLVTAKINIADIYFKQGQFIKAEDEYKKILVEYKEDTVCKLATQGLSDIYISMNKPEKIEQLAAQYSCLQLSPDEQENLYYLPAIQLYNDSSFTEAIPKFEVYLGKFTQGRYVNEVVNYLAHSYYNTGNKEKAIELYRKSLAGPNTGFTEIAAIRVASYLYNKGEYKEVIPYYQRMEQVSATAEVVFNARLGLMRSHFLNENWAQAQLYAEKVLNYSELNNALKLEAFYAQGMSAYYMNRFDVAKPALEWIVKNTTTVKAAEAKFSIAEILFKQSRPTEADKTINELLKMKPAYNYWIARSLILRSKIYVLNNDLFNAEQTLKSVIEHYPNSDDGILDEANQQWDELMQLKNQPKRTEEKTETIIEINEQKGN